VKVLFVCAGNICRSPFAEGLARRLADELGLDVDFASAGTIAIDGAPASDDALAVAREHGVDLSGHRARRVSSLLTDEADLVLPLHDVLDPIGRGRDAYRESYAQIERSVRSLLERLS
jgi:protein-tyrosine phosphatase